MVQAKKTLIFILSFVLIFSLFGVVTNMKKTLGATMDLKLSATDTDIQISGILDTVTNDTKLVRFKPNQYHCSENFLVEYDGLGDDNKRDGYTVDRNYYDTNQAGIYEIEIVTTTFSITIPRFSTLKNEVGYDKIYDKFYIINGGTLKDGLLFGGDKLAGGLNVTDFPSKSHFQIAKATSIKGLEIMNVDDAENLGIKHGAITFDLPGLLTSKSARDAIPFTVNGKEYYFSANYLKNYDTKVRENSEANIQTTFVLVIWRTSISKAFAEIVHPDNTTSNVNALSIIASNLTTQAGIDYFIAMYEFLAERYTREDEKYGRVSNFVIGNEVDAAYEWNNMGYLPMDEYMRQYERTVRAAYTAIRKYHSKAVVLIPTTHFWNKSTAEQFGIMEYVEKGAFSSRSILDNFARLAKEHGDFEWELAYHPYRATHMGEPVFWDAINVNEAPHNENATKITPINIDVLATYLQREELKYCGRTRNFYLTESGVASPHEPVAPNGSYNPSNYDPTNFPQEALEQQAAAYAYTYYSFLFSGAKSYIFHRHTDVIGENGVNIGIWLRCKGSDDLYGKKPIWNVMKYIDTERSLEVTTPYLKWIKLYPSDRVATSWKELIPNFDEKLLENTPIEQIETLDKKDNPSNAMLTNFETTDTGGWLPVNRAISTQIFNDKSMAAAGNGFLMVRYNNTGREGGGFAEKGIEKKFTIPEDLTKYQSFNFSVLVGKLKVKDPLNIKVRFYSGDQILEYRTTVQPDRYERCSADLSVKWDHFDRVDKIKIWFNVQNPTTESSVFNFDEIGFSKKKKSGGCSSGAATLVGSIVMLGGIALKKWF